MIIPSMTIIRSYSGRRSQLLLTFSEVTIESDVIPKLLKNSHTQASLFIERTHIHGPGSQKTGTTPVYLWTLRRHLCRRRRGQCLHRQLVDPDLVRSTPVSCFRRKCFKVLTDDSAQSQIRGQCTADRAARTGWDAGQICPETSREADRDRL